MGGRGGDHEREKGEKRRPTHPDPALFRRKKRRPLRRPPERHYDPPPDGEWSEAIDRWVAERQREKEKDPERDPKDDRDRRLPRPWLDCTSNFGPQITAHTRDQETTVHFTVWNEGNAPAWTCYVEVYEGPRGYAHPLSDYELRGQAIITLQPGEKRTVELPWVRRWTTGRIVGLVFDPMLDPKDFHLVEQYNRHITSIHWSELP